MSPQELISPSIQELDKLSFENRRDQINSTYQKKNSNLSYNINYLDSDHNISNNQVNNNNPNFGNTLNKTRDNNFNQNVINNNRAFDETKKFSILKGMEYLINLFESRNFKFIYSNLHSIYSNFFKRLKLIFDIFNSNQCNNNSYNKKRSFSRSNSSNSHLYDQNT